MGTAKPFFGPVPARAAGDARLTGLHMKLLTAIAAHDRMSDPRGEGQGCWAGNKRLAEMIGCNYTNLSAALGGLAKWGYIERRQNPLNKKRRIFYVVYIERDAAFVGAVPEADSLPTGKQSGMDTGRYGLPTGKGRDGIVCPSFSKSDENQSVVSGE